MIELKIDKIEDRVTVGAILLRNGYTVSPVKRKKGKTGYEYILQAYIRTETEEDK